MNLLSKKLVRNHDPIDRWRRRFHNDSVGSHHGSLLLQILLQKSLNIRNSFMLPAHGTRRSRGSRIVQQRSFSPVVDITHFKHCTGLILGICQEREHGPSDYFWLKKGIFRHVEELGCFGMISEQGRAHDTRSRSVNSWHRSRI